MSDLTIENFESTEFILKHNVLLNRSTVSPHNLASLRYTNKIMHRLPRRQSVGESTNACHEWMLSNTFHETRYLDCLHSTEFVDPDPIPELFPQYTMRYMATVFDPDTAKAFSGITDMLQPLYSHKFGPGTPQAFLYETPIVGWVMYYELGQTTWIVEIQGSNVLRGGILGLATGRRHFYRRLLRDFLLCTRQTADYVLLAYEDQHELHSMLRPCKPMPPSTPYRHEVMEWCGFTKKRLGDLDVEYKTHAPMQLLTDDVQVWHYAPGEWASI